LRPFLAASGCDVQKGPAPEKVAALLKERVNTLKELADAAVYFYRPVDPPEPLVREHYAPEAKGAFADLRDQLAQVEWKRERINEALKAVLAQHKLKMPRLAMPLRVMMSGGTHTPSID